MEKSDIESKQKSKVQSKKSTWYFEVRKRSLRKDTETKEKWTSWKED